MMEVHNKYETQDIIDRLKEIVQQAERTPRTRAHGEREVRTDHYNDGTTNNFNDVTNNPTYGTSSNSEMTNCPDGTSPIIGFIQKENDTPKEEVPCCGGPYEVRCRQALDGQDAKATIKCTIRAQDDYQPIGGIEQFAPKYRAAAADERNQENFSNEQRAMLRKFLDRQHGCSGVNGFCPASRYEQFMAGYGGLPQGHPDNNRPEKFHHAFGMGANPHVNRN